MFQVQVANDFAHDRERVLIVVRKVVGDAGDARVHVGAAEFFGGHFLAGRRFDQRRSAEKDRAVAFDDDRFVAHRRNVRAAGRARSHHRGDLRNALARHARLIVEDAPEVFAVGKHLGLQRQERAARVDQVDARQMVLLGDLLRAQMLLDRHRIVRAALDGRVVGDDRAELAFDDADAGDDAGAGRIVAVHAVGRERREFEKIGTRIDQPLDPLARGELVALAMFGGRLGSAAGVRGRETLAQSGD